MVSISGVQDANTRDGSSAARYVQRRDSTTGVEGVVSGGYRFRWCIDVTKLSCYCSVVSRISLFFFASFPFGRVHLWFLVSRSIYC